MVFFPSRFCRKSSKPQSQSQSQYQKQAEEKKAQEARKNSEDSTLLGMFAQFFSSKKTTQTGTISRSGSVDRNKYFG